MEDLKERIFKVIEKQVEMKEFENWLYSNIQLSERMDEELILQLYIFNYNQQGVDYEFKTLFLSFFEEREFTDWKIIANLETLSEGCKEPETILADFCDLGYENYPYLTSIGYNKYELEDYAYFNRSREQMINEIQEEASQLLAEIKDWLRTHPGEDLSKFESRTKKIDMIPNNFPENVIKTESTSNKWWEFWK
ncbi:hypothetical protein GCM10011506_47220 [Marivirga lumbricoides]|uniref:DUF4240 domain-containing protein n=1 Tax=Marivirga lumbricoides TaxID=1046115 RepID=A0ABQ1N6N4_9BACT|nr:hypothetical protein GCM10011506_47220 [Marivirga lumbricoides]